jgi:hypothetical protein
MSTTRLCFLTDSGEHMYTVTLYSHSSTLHPFSLSIYSSSSPLSPLSSLYSLLLIPNFPKPSALPPLLPSSQFITHPHAPKGNARTGGKPPASGPASSTRSSTAAVGPMASTAQSSSSLNAPSVSPEGSAPHWSWSNPVATTAPSPRPSSFKPLAAPWPYPNPFDTPAQPQRVTRSTTRVAAAGLVGATSTPSSRAAAGAPSPASAGEGPKTHSRTAEDKPAAPASNNFGWGVAIPSSSPLHTTEAGPTSTVPKQPSGAKTSTSTSSANPMPAPSPGSGIAGFATPTTTPNVPSSTRQRSPLTPSSRPTKVGRTDKTEDKSEPKSKSKSTRKTQSSRKKKSE